MLPLALFLQGATPFLFWGFLCILFPFQMPFLSPPPGSQRLHPCLKSSIERQRQLCLGHGRGCVLGTGPGTQEVSGKRLLNK